MSEQEQSARRVGRIISALVLSMFLIGMPIGSYIYLKKGYDYQKEAVRSLRKEHRMSLPGGLTHLDGSLAFQNHEDYHLIGLIPDGSSLERYAEVLKRLHAQFDEPENIVLWSVFEGGDSTQLETFKKMADLPKDTSQLLYWAATEANFATFVDDLQLIKEETLLLSEGLIALVDDSLYVRRAFPFTDEESMQQLVERTAILLPERSKPKPELRPREEL